MAKKPLIDPYPPIAIPAGLMREILITVSSHREMCDAYLRGYSTHSKKLKADLACANELLGVLRPLMAECEAKRQDADQIE